MNKYKDDMSEYKDDIIRLRKQGKSYRDIEKELDCSRGTISYHCKNEGLEDTGMKDFEISDDKKEAIREHYKSHTASETGGKFSVSPSTVRRYGRKKNSVSVNEFDQDKAQLFELFSGGQTDVFLGKHKQGTLAEQKVVTEAIRRGSNVCKPLIECRYDYIFDNGLETRKIQAKSTKQTENGCYVLGLTSKCRNNTKKCKYTADEIDAVIGYIFQEDVFVIIPPEIFENRKSISLRYQDSKIDHSSINNLEDYIW